MESKTSFFNKGILLNDLKRFLWLGIVYFVVLFFSIPVQILTSYDNNKDKMRYPKSMKFIFSFDSEPLTILIYAVPVLVALILFRYMQNKKSVDLIHSLPLKREKLYDNHVFFGILTLVIPVIVTAIICYLLKISLSLNDLKLHFAYSDVAYWAGVTMLLTVFIFLFTVLMGMLTGLTTSQGILTYIFLFLPVGLSMLIFYNLKINLYGFAFDYYAEGNILLLSPLSRITKLQLCPMKSSEAIVYIVLSILIFISARILYKKRKSEALSNAVAFEVLQPVFKYGVTFCCMLVGGIYFSSIGKKLPWIIFGYIVAAFIGYIISEMIIKKSLKVFRNLKGYCIYSAIMALIIICMNVDIIGFQKKIPPLNEIESVFFDYGFNSLYRKDGESRDFYKEPSNIENIQKLHMDITNNKTKYNNFNNTSNVTPVALMYKLKNGSTIKRQYMVSNEIYVKNVKDIYESKEYKAIEYPILSKDSSSIDKIYIRARNSSHKELTLINPLEIKEFTDILKDEIINESYSGSQKLPWSSIDISLFTNEKDTNSNELINDRNTDIHCTFKQSYTKLEKWLTEKGYIKSAKTMPEDIDYVVIEKFTGSYRNIDKNDKNVKRLEIKDKAQIETCLRNTYQDNEGEYSIGFYTKNNGTIYGVLKKDSLPSFVTQYFK